MEGYEMKKVRIALFAFLVMLNIMSLHVEAEEARYEVTDTIAAVLSSDGVLTLSGTGELPNYMIAPQAPWYMKKESIKKIVIGEGITRIGDNVFSECACSEVKLPSTLVSIGKNGFFCCSALQCISLPDSLTDIENGAFCGCSALGTVEFGKGIKRIGDRVFRSSGLKEIVIPDSVVSLGGDLFQECPFLVKVEIKGSMTSTPYGLFDNCPLLEEIIFNEGLETLDRGCIISCGKLSKITLPSTLKEIKDDAVYDCNNLCEVKIPDNVTYIGKTAFDECDNIKLDVPDHLKKSSTGSYMELMTIKIKGTYDYEKAYEVLKLVNKERKKEGLSALTMDKDLLEAAMLRAMETNVLVGHTRPNGLDCRSVCDKVMGENLAGGMNSAKAAMTTWMGSNGHRSNILNKSYKSIGVGCFYQDGNCYWIQLFGTEKADTGKKPSNQVAVREVELEKDTKIQLVSQQNDWTMVKGEVRGFAVRMESLDWDVVTIALDESNFDWKTNKKKIATVGQDGDIKAKKKGTATITYSLKIQPSVKGTAKLKVVNSYDGYGFYRIIDRNKGTVAYTHYKDKDATIITIPNTIKIFSRTYKVVQVDKNVFKNNKQLKEIKLGKYVTTIGNDAFSGCSNLEKVTTNTQLRKIGKRAFKNCKNMKTFTIKTTKLKDSTVGKDAFKKTGSKIKVKVPKSKYKTYKKMLKKRGLSKKAYVGKL